jgi:small-conductance mechanosensitive channel
MFLEFVVNEYLRYGLLVAVVIFLAFLISTGLRSMLNHFIRRYAFRLKADPTNFSFVKNSVSFFVYTVAVIIIFYNIPSLRALGTALFAGAGIIAAIIGFASQKAFSNIISGIFILIFKPFRVGDTIEFGQDLKGVVEEITLRHTTIRNYENRRVLVPNNIISDDTIINSNITDTLIRKHVVFSISYDSDIDRAVAIIQDEARKHPLFIDNRTVEEKKKNADDVVVRVTGLSDFSIDLKAFIWTDGNDNGYVLMTDLLKSVKQRFDREGIEIPFPYRTIVFKKEINEAKNPDQED